MRKVLLLAGEESGVLYARQIAAKLREVCPNVEIRGYGDYGFETGDLAVMGFLAVLRKIFFFLRVKRTLERAIDEWRPDVICTVDYPGMNLKLAAYAKRRGVRAVHVVCPQVWAWKAGRIPKIEASLDKLCCFFPFEPALFRPGFAAFVGHPLAEAFASVRPRSDSGTSEGEERPLVALLPGSRLGEIESHLPTMLAAVRGLDVRVAIPAANVRAQQAIEALSAGSSVEVLSGGARELLQKARCAVVASGTATLEAALARCPTVLVYRVGVLLAWFARRVIKGIRHVGLANIIAEKAGVECPMPELLQEDFTADNVRKYISLWLKDEDSRSEAAARLDATMRHLCADGDSMTKIVRFLV